MRVAALMATEAVSGPGRQLAALGSALRREGVELHAILFQRRSSRPPVADYLERAGVPHSLVPDRGPLDWGLITSVGRRLQELDVSLVQTHGYKATAVGYVLRRRGPGRWPWIGFYHGATDKGLKDRLYQWLEARLLSGADQVVVVSRQQRAGFNAGARITLIHNAVIPVSQAGREAAADRLRDRLAGLPRPLLGVVGRLSREKGVDVFLEACARLKDDGHAFSAAIVGDGPEEEELLRRRKTLGLEDRVRFLGRIDAVAAVYSAVDLVVLPSRSEGLPNVLLEALSAGVSVVATAVGAVPDVLTDPAAGRLVPPDDAAALARGIQDALEQGTRPARPDAVRAREQILGRFSLDHRVRQHLELYRQLAGDPPGRRPQPTP